MLHRHGLFPCFCNFISIQREGLKTQLEQEKKRISWCHPYLNCALKSSSMSSSSQLSSQSLSPPSVAAPGATPPKCAESVWESSQSVLRKAGWPQQGPFQCALGGLTLGGKLFKLVIFLQHAEMSDTTLLFRRFRGLGWIFLLGRRSGG